MFIHHNEAHDESHRYKNTDSIEEIKAKIKWLMVVAGRGVWTLPLVCGYYECISNS